MNEIKFRIWNNDEKIMNGENNNYGNGYKEEYRGNIGEVLFTIIEDLNNLKCFELMQYTGLCDRNGKEIYEGDLLKYEVMNTAGIYEVIKKDGKFQGVEHISEDLYEDLCNINNTTEIVGNIYENKNLLTK